MSLTIAVVDYGRGNLRSVVQALHHVSADQARIVLASTPELLLEADKIVFPGQGAMRDCMAALSTSGLDQVIRDVIRTKPFLGICLGAQVLFESSEEDGHVPALNIYSGQVVKFPVAQMQSIAEEKLKVPHLGWNQVTQVKTHPLFQGIDNDARFYFAHSYYMVPANPALNLGTTVYPFHFSTVIGQDNVFATQFHPEKSARDGLRLLKNFLDWDGQGA